LLRNAITTFLLDIEGTTTPIDFVYRILFPYARAHAEAYLAMHRSSPDLQADIAGLLAENGEDTRKGLNPPSLNVSVDRVPLDELVTYVHWLMDRDRKSTPLKSLQGKIWEEGYKRGELRGQVFQDVPRALARWREQQKEIYIYSSGSVLAQKLLFSNTAEAGDLTPFISSYFDTSIGLKKDAESYRRIAGAVGKSPSEILFVSDVSAELDAAATIGLDVILCVRPGNVNPTTPSSHRIIQSFDELR
jgi:enolase-phosphatase E1